jgi:hypothetical protein
MMNLENVGGFESGELPRNCWQGRYNHQCSDSKVKEKDLRSWLVL